VKKSFGSLEFSLSVILVYALVLYMEAFRIIEGGQFETALQVEKIIFFCIIETVFLWTLSKNRIAGLIFLTAILISSWWYDVDRYNRRFPIFHLTRSSDQALNALTFDRAKGVLTSVEQAQELESVVSIVRKNTDAEDKIFVYPDMGSYYFLCNRGFIGRFPIATLAWMREDWHQELIRDLDTQKPKLVILKRKLEDDYTKVYFQRKSNEDHFKEFASYIGSHYDLIATTPVSGIYLIKK
jgi:hypothetical protein